MSEKPEDRARRIIDEKLTQAGWKVQRFADADLTAGLGIALTEFPLKPGCGRADYLLYVADKAVGVVEAKPEGDTLTGVEVQTEKYSVGLPDNLPKAALPLPFLYQSTGAETQFTNALDPDPVSREVFSFLTPETIAEELGLGSDDFGSSTVAEGRVPYVTGSLLHRLRALPPLATAGMRACQIEAITALERSLAQNRRRALVQMQTGSGKTYTAVAEAYRLIKHAKARRVLFLVDRGNLARQTLAEFQSYVTPDDGRKFTELYNVQHLQSNQIDPVCNVVITTIQRLYSILKGEPEFDPASEEETIGGLAALRKEPLPVVYNRQVPIETFDFVFTDECHRSIYNLWRQVLEYFDAYLIGLTATPSKQTLGFFRQNLVMEYGHAQAVADAVNVDFDVYRIRTQLTEQGGKVEAQTIVDRRDRKSRRVRWEELEEDLDYKPNELDRAIVVPDQIRTVIRTFKERLFTEIFPGRTEVPKTLIFAKDDSHAEDIVRIVREEFHKGNEFCEKITYRTSTARIVDPVTGEVSYRSSGLKPEDLLSSFRNAYNPRIAVTVDMIATGTDVKPLEIVFFMRDVLSANYFEQMKGRGCRVVSPTEFQNVTPDAANKTRYVIVDAVGVTEHKRTDSPPLERQPTIPLKTILQAIGAGSTDEEVVSTTASRLARLERIIGPGQRAELEALAGKSMAALIGDLARSVDPDVIEEAAIQATGNPAPPPEALAKVALRLRTQAVLPLRKAPVRNHILSSLQDAEQTVAHSERDVLEFAGASAEATEKARTTVTSFRQYLEEHRDEITAIQLLYARPAGKGPTLKQLKELAAMIHQPPHAWTPEKLWLAYEVLEKDRVRGHGGKAVTDLVSLVRYALEQESILQPFGETVDDRFTAWLAAQETAGRTFTPDQRRWLEMIRDHIALSLTIEQDDFELPPFTQQGGLGKAYEVFGDGLTPLLRELTGALVA